MQGAQIQSLVREVLPALQCSTPKKEREEKAEKSEGAGVEGRLGCLQLWSVLGETWPLRFKFRRIFGGHSEPGGMA